MEAHVSKMFPSTAHEKRPLPKFQINGSSLGPICFRILQYADPSFDATVEVYGNNDMQLTKERQRSHSDLILSGPHHSFWSVYCPRGQLRPSSEPGMKNKGVYETRQESRKYWHLLKQDQVFRKLKGSYYPKMLITMLKASCFTDNAK